MTTLALSRNGTPFRNSFSPFGVDCRKCARRRQWAGAQNHVIAITLRDLHAPNSSNSDLSTPYHWALSHCGTAPISIWLQFTRSASGTWCMIAAGIEAQSPPACCATGAIRAPLNSRKACPGIWRAMLEEWASIRRNRYDTGCVEKRSVNNLASCWSGGLRRLNFLVQLLCQIAYSA